jgi:hypothetical protein
LAALNGKQHGSEVMWAALLINYVGLILFMYKHSGQPLKDYMCHKSGAFGAVKT